MESALTEAFPSPAKVARTGENECGDLTFEINGKHIMFEVKNYDGKNVKGRNKGQEIEHFFRDAQQIKLGYR